MQKPLLTRFATALGLLGLSLGAHAQGPITNGGTYKITHYGVVADNSAEAFGVPAGTPLCLDVNLNSPDAGATVGQWGDNGLDAQRFIFELQADGSYKLRHKGTVMYLQPVGLSKVAGTRIEQNVLLAANDDAQRWFITDPNSNGRYKFTLKNSANAQGVSQVLEVGFGSPAPGAPVNLWDDNGFEPAQRWVLSRIVLSNKNKAETELWLRAFPNPVAQGQQVSLQVEAQHRGPAQVQLLDMLGRPVHSQAAELAAGGNPLTLNTAALAPGLYLVRLTQGEMVQQTRVVVH
ncbi:RICIN domain-containing protein [Hymenobacter metallicola]|uniref:T9SS type A sorting domain-containing protein n=1 Tax=Hymenobacter metallicola TaxID=2563114 RepID=A0A4Z0QGK6_9BACT|nr:RICIN domain-containing protein [Hymenobacter metallicola]TGE29160.1 T9SS type A sorting domain-containing protein [Hymenobacter metallicola]